jgi:hypothetical protein
LCNRTLFGRWSVVCTWGCMRSNFQQQRSVPCESEEAVCRLVLQVATRKLRRGYTLKIIV